MRATLLASFVLLLVPWPAPAQEGTTLRWDLAPGRSWRFVIEQHQVMTQPGVEEPVQTKDQRHELTLTVREVLEGGDVRVVLRFDRVKVTLTPRGKPPQVLDSDQPGGGGEARIAGQDIVCVVSPLGALRDVERFGDATLAKMPPAERAMMGAVLGEGMLMNLVLALLSPLPEGPVQVGSTWDVSSRVAAGGLDMSMTTTNRVEAIGADGVVTIKQTGGATLHAPPGAALDVSRIEVTHELQGGMLRSSVGTIELDMNMQGQVVFTRSTIERRREE